MENPPPIDPMYSPPPFQTTSHIAYASVVAPTTRPGILTAVGIISIVLGSLGILANCSGIFQAIMYKSMSAFGSTGFAGPPTMTTTGSGTTVTTWSTGSGGVSVASATTAPLTSATAPVVTTMPAIFNMRSATTNMMLFEAILSMGVAITLLVLGILTLLNKRSARRGHLIYAWVKFGAIVVSVTSTWMMYSDIFSSMGTISGGAMTGSMTLVIAVFSGLIGCIYPIALLITLRSRSVMNFYENQLPGAGLQRG